MVAGSVDLRLTAPAFQATYRSLSTPSRRGAIIAAGSAVYCPFAPSPHLFLPYPLPLISLRAVTPLLRTLQNHQHDADAASGRAGITLRVSATAPTDILPITWRHITPLAGSWQPACLLSPAAALMALRHDLPARVEGWAGQYALTVHSVTLSTS